MLTMLCIHARDTKGKVGLGEEEMRSPVWGNVEIPGEVLVERPNSSSTHLESQLPSGQLHRKEQQFSLSCYYVTTAAITPTMPHTLSPPILSILEGGPPVYSGSHVRNLGVLF